MYKESIIFSISHINIFYTSLLEAFSSYINFTLLISFIITFPLIIYHFIIFSINGLYKYQVDKLLFIIVKYIVFLTIIYYLLFWQLIYYIFNFFFSYQNDNLELNLKIIDLFKFYNGYIWFFFLISILTVLPISLKNNRILIYFFLFIFISLFTPPDLITSILIFIPFIVLIEINYFFTLGS